MTTMPQAALIGLLAIAGNAAAHGGGLNAEGCHDDRKNGGYHCHRGGASRASQGASRNPVAPTQPHRRSLDNPRSGTGVYYANCSAARAAGAAPVRRGEPGYAGHLDRDGDGVGCE